MANSPLLQIPQLGPSQAQKEVTINDGFSIIERSLNDIQVIGMSGGDVTLNLTDYTRAMLYRCSGHTVERTLTVPASKRFFAVQNVGTQPVTVVTTEAGLEAVVPPASYCVLFNDGEDITMISDSAASGQVSAFLSLPDTPSSFDGQAGRAMIVNEAENGLTFGTITVGFTDLTDVPNAYTDSAGKVVSVNMDADGLEFKDYIDAFLALTDTPITYEGNAGRMVIVSPDEEGLIFEDVPEPIIQATRIFELENAGFEDGDLDGWITPTTSGQEWVVGPSQFSLTAPEGINMVYYPSGQGIDPATLGREIDLLDQAYPEELDGNAEIIVEIGMASIFGDYGQIEIEFYDELDELIDTAESPAFIGTDTFIDRRLRTAIPEGSRRVIVYLKAIKNEEGSIEPEELSFAFDDLRVQLKLEVDQINTFIQLFDTPLSYDGNQLRFLRVNADGTGIEFVAPDEDDANAFTGLLDTPEDYSGANGMFVKVNEEGNGLVFEDGSILDLIDAPNTFIGQAGRALVVNEEEDALIFADIEGGGGSSTLSIVNFNSSGNRTLSLGDVGSYIRMNRATACTVTVPTNAAAAFAVGTQIPIRQVGIGQVTVLPSSGVTVNTSETLSLRKQHSGATLIKVGADEWDLVGDLELAP